MTEMMVGGETFEVLVEGDEACPAVLLCHPLGANLRIWDSLAPHLLKQFRVVRYDGRGHGGSTLAGGPYSVRRLGLDAVAILDAIGIDKTHVIGCSQGGAVGQWLLVNAPDRVERVVLANTAAQFGPAQTWNERIVAARRDGMRDLAEATIARWFSASFREHNAADVAPVHRSLRDVSAEGYASACAALRDFDIRAELSKIEHAVLVIAGRDDPSISAQQTDLLAGSIPDARSLTLDTRHISHVEDAAGFAKAVVDFLTSKAAPRRTASKLPRRATRDTVTALPVSRRPPGRRLSAARGGIAKVDGRPASRSATGANAPSQVSAGKAPKAAVRPAPKSKDRKKQGAKSAAATGRRTATATRAAEPKASPGRKPATTRSVPPPRARTASTKTATAAASPKKTTKRKTVAAATATPKPVTSRRGQAKGLGTRAAAARTPAKAVSPHKIRPVAATAGRTASGRSGIKTGKAVGKTGKAGVTPVRKAVAKTTKPTRSGTTGKAAAVTLSATPNAKRSPGLRKASGARKPSGRKPSGPGKA